MIFKENEFNFDPATYKPYVANSSADLLKTFDDNVAKGKQAPGRRYGGKFGTALVLED